ncbi:hypothetical protein M378DRAFT_157666 [Amanita muscaria Koide BX008]|uniref:Uncharacterized protein n=1 Tax=Amanita muscaria (strain Koide BX008) TaxID=946122 RepID=A0A0C2X562_AMAMK|nr:hypothetical protein M378DRAFT_157666 [Amanita muscaria Koide BX008]
MFTRKAVALCERAECTCRRSDQVTSPIVEAPFLREAQRLRRRCAIQFVDITGRKLSLLSRETASAPNQVDFLTLTGLLIFTTVEEFRSRNILAST